MCEMCAEKLVGWEKSWVSFTPIYRTIDNGRARQTLLKREPTNSPEWQRIGEVFEQSQDAREWANDNPEPRPKYKLGDNAPPFTRSEALTLIELTEEAVSILDQL